MTVQLPVRPSRDVRLSCDIDQPTAARVDALAAAYRVRRAELLRAMVIFALAHQEEELKKGAAK